MQINRQKIELTIIAFVLFMLVLGVFFAIKPFSMFKQSRNATRENHMQTIMVAIYSYAVDHEGFFPDCIPEEENKPIEIGVCKEQLEMNISGPFPVEPDSNYKYMIERIGKKRFKIFSTAPEAKEIVITQ